MAPKLSSNSSKKGVLKRITTQITTKNKMHTHKLKQPFSQNKSLFFKLLSLSAIFFKTFPKSQLHLTVECFFSGYFSCLARWFYKIIAQELGGVACLVVYLYLRYWSRHGEQCLVVLKWKSVFGTQVNYIMTLTAHCLVSCGVTMQLWLCAQVTIHTWTAEYILTSNFISFSVNIWFAVHEKMFMFNN